MAQLIAIYRTPKDAAAFDKYYFETHIPLAKKIHGLNKYEVNDGKVGGADDVHLIAILHFDDMAALQTALTSPEGQAAAGDVANFASGGAELLMYETKEI